LIPATAAGIINGTGHYQVIALEAPDASTNISPWGIMIGRRRVAQQPPHLPHVRQVLCETYESDIGWFTSAHWSACGFGDCQEGKPKRSWVKSNRR
jgi:stearoyl-CoA desaturase (delta-9 desaturase)